MFCSFYFICVSSWFESQIASWSAWQKTYLYQAYDESFFQSIQLKSYSFSVVCCLNFSSVLAPLTDSRVVLVYLLLDSEFPIHVFTISFFRVFPEKSASYKTCDGEINTAICTLLWARAPRVASFINLFAANLVIYVSLQIPTHCAALETVYWEQQFERQRNQYYLFIKRRVLNSAV